MLLQHRISGFYPKPPKRMGKCWNVAMLLNNIRKNSAICRSNYGWNKLHSELTQRCMMKSTDTAHGCNVEKSRKYQLLATYFNIRTHPESFTKELGKLSHPELLLVTKTTPVRLSTRNKSHYVNETKICALRHLCRASKQSECFSDCDRIPARAVWTRPRAGDTHIHGDDDDKDKEWSAL